MFPQYDFQYLLFYYFSYKLYLQLYNIQIVYSGFVMVEKKCLECVHLRLFTHSISLTAWNLKSRHQQHLFFLIQDRIKTIYSIDCITVYYLRNKTNDAKQERRVAKHKKKKKIYLLNKNVLPHKCSL